MKLNPQSAPMIVVLASLVAIGQISTSMYLPSLPTIVEQFNTTTGLVQLTISVYLLGWAGSVLIVGPISDWLGRKPIIIVGLLVHIGASVACAFVSSIGVFILLRFIQAIGGATTSVLPRAIVRDIYEGESAARMLSFMGAFMAIMQGIAPIIGGYLHVIFGWESNFVFMGVFGIMLLGVVLFFMDETLENPDPRAIHLINLFKNYYKLLKHWRFMGYVTCASLSAAGNFAFLSGASFILLETYNISAEYFGYFFGIGVLGFVAGTIVGAHYTIRIGIEKLVNCGVMLVAASGVAMMLMAWLGFQGVYTVIVPQVIYFFGVGIVSPQSTAGALTPFPKMAGIASSLFGFFIISAGSFSGMLVGQTFDGTQLPMATIIGLTGLLSFISYKLFLRKARSKMS